MKTPMKAFVEKSRWQASKLGYTSGNIDEDVVREAMHLHLRGRNDEAVEMLSEISKDQRSPKAWRILGHAELSRGNASTSRRYHEESLRINQTAGDKLSAADDLVNIASTYIDTKDYDAAWEAAEKASTLSPNAWAPYVVRISVLNNRGDKVVLKGYLDDLMLQRPGLKNDPDFRRHLEDDLDFIGIDALIQEEKIS